MAYNNDDRRFSGPAGNALTALQGATIQNAKAFDFDALMANMTDFQKTRDAKLKADQEFNSKIAELDMKAQWYGIGRAYGDPRTGKAGIVPYPPAVAPQVSPAAQASGAYGAAAAGLPAPGAPNAATADPIQAAIAGLPPNQRALAQRQLTVDAAKQAQETKVLSGEQINSITAYSNTIDQLEQVIKDMEENKYKTGPVLAGGKYGFSELPMSTTARARSFTPEETAFYANSRALMSDYLKAMTGAQRGFQEVKFLQPALPDPSSMTPEQFVKVGKEAIRRSKANLTNVLDFTRAAKYRNVDELARVARIRGDQVERDENSFASVDEARAAKKAGKLKKGQQITIAGQPATVK